MLNLMNIDLTDAPGGYYSDNLLNQLRDDLGEPGPSYDCSDIVDDIEILLEEADIGEEVIYDIILIEPKDMTDMINVKEAIRGDQEYINHYVMLLEFKENQTRYVWDYLSYPDHILEATVWETKFFELNPHTEIFFRREGE